MVRHRKPDEGGGVILEYMQMGQYVKVSAIDVITHEEVSIVGDARQGEQRLASIAMRKLRYVQSKR